MLLFAVCLFNNALKLYKSLGLTCKDHGTNFSPDTFQSRTKQLGITNCSTGFWEVSDHWVLGPIASSGIQEQFPEGAPKIPNEVLRPQRCPQHWTKLRQCC